MIKDNDGKKSLKRCIAIIGVGQLFFLTMTITWEALSRAEPNFNAAISAGTSLILPLVIICIGGSVAEKFNKK